jgi:hypothetical protein
MDRILHRSPCRSGGKYTSIQLAQHTDGMSRYKGVRRKCGKIHRDLSLNV